MAFPGAIPSFTGFTSSHTLAQDVHAAQHNLEQSEIIAIATKMGTGASTPTSGKLLRGTGVGTSSWAQADLTTDVTGVLPAANGGTGISSLGAGIATFLGIPSSANLASAVTDETGSGGLVFANTPTLTTPTIASFVNANHNHTNSAGGGTLGNTAFTNGQGLSYRLGLATKTTTSDVIPNAYTTYLTIAATSLAKEVEIQYGINLLDGSSGSNRSGNMRIQVDGVTLSGSDVIWRTNVADGAANSHMIMSHTPTAGSHTWTLQVNANTASATLLDQAYLRINQII